MAGKHIFANIAPELNEDEISGKFLSTWKWCIRCGILKLGRKYFRPGRFQKLTIAPSDGGPCLGVRYDPNDRP